MAHNIYIYVYNCVYIYIYISDRVQLGTPFPEVCRGPSVAVYRITSQQIALQHITMQNITSHYVHIALHYITLHSLFRVTGPTAQVQRGPLQAHDEACVSKTHKAVFNI